MHAKTLIAIVSLVLASLGWVHGSVVQAFCTDTGERGFALSPLLACLAIDCHTSEASDGDCTDEDCCDFDAVPAQPLVPQAAPQSLGETASASNCLLPLESPANRNDAPLRRLGRSGSPPGTDSAAFPGYPLPLLI